MIANMILFMAFALNDTVPQTTSYKAIVVDAETHMRIKDAKVVVDGGVAETKTIWDGSFSVNVPFKQLSISQKGYLTRKMNYEERTDTIFLLNNYKNIDEVVVWGKRPTSQMNMKMTPGDAIGRVSQPSGMDFLGALDHIVHAKKYKRKKKCKENLEKY